MNAIRHETPFQNEAESYLSGAWSWKADLRPSSKWMANPGMKSWDRPGVEALVEKGQFVFQEETGIFLPANMSTHGPWVWARREGRVETTDESTGYVETAARVGGWLRAAADLPSVTRLLERCTSTRGMNSPATTVDLYRLVERYPSPGRCERALRATRARADRILAPYLLSASWEGLGRAMTYGPRRTGKAAIMAAACTLGGSNLVSYRQARDWMTKMSATVSSMMEEFVGRTVMVREQPVAYSSAVALYHGTIPSRRRGHRKSQWIAQNEERTVLMPQYWGTPSIVEAATALQE